VGGTKTAAAVVDLTDGTLLERSVVPTEAGRDGESVLSDVIGLVTDLVEVADEQGHALAGLGVGVAELIDHEGIVRSSQTLDWEGYDLAARFRGLADLIVVESDVRAGAIAEGRSGAGVDRSSYVFVSVGTGVSSTFVLDGRPWRGVHGNAIIAATGPIAIRCRHCGEDQLVVPEEVASGAGIEASYSHLSTSSNLSAEAIIQLAEQGDELATSVVGDAAAALASVVGSLINLLDPECVIVGGGLGAATGLYWDLFVGRIDRHLVARQSHDTPIVQSLFGSDGPVIGAAFSVAGT